MGAFTRPPAKAGPPLTPPQVALIRRWIEQGAAYAEHWAFKPPIRQPLPEVSDHAWPRNGLDSWIMARLDRGGLHPSPEADRFLLLRRASLDLRGLPPTLQELDAFASDTTPDAYEKAVDRFLDDPSYGERWARVWLDLARYADSAGYGSDPLRMNIYRYRDWVIDAFNRNVPFDRFTVEQIAGDLLPDSTTEQRMATAFHRNTMTNTEGGTDDEEFRVAAIKDRTDTTMQVWMGFTAGCARCHTHKYDPITHEEYYKLYAIFNQTEDTDRADEQPLIPVPTSAQDAEIQRIETRIAALKQVLDADTPDLVRSRAAWEAALMSEPTPWTVLAPIKARAKSGALLEPKPDGSLLATGDRPEHDVYTITAKAELNTATAFRLEAIPDPALPKGGAGRADDGGFVVSRFAVETAHADDSSQSPMGRFVRVALSGKGKMVSLAEVQVFSGGENVARTGKATQSSTGFGGLAERAIDGKTDGDYQANSTTHTNVEADPWWEVKLSKALPIDQITLWNRTDGGLGSRLARARVEVLDDAHKVVWQTDIAEPPNPSLALTPSGCQPVPLARALADFNQAGFDVADVLDPATPGKNGWAVGPRQSEPHSAVFLAKVVVSLKQGYEFVFKIEQTPKHAGQVLGRFRLSVSNDPRAIERAALPASILAILNQPAAQRTVDQEDALATYYRSIAPSLDPARAEIARLEKSRPKVISLPVLVELPADQRRETHLMNKGNYLDPGKKVEPGVPAAFPPLPEGAPANRLALARWLVDSGNPLTARVAVNRLWARLFGVGLVETEEDFGTQGDRPSHPELLDWLATEYIRIGWDMKAMLREIVTSATYRQTSKVTPELLAKDPRNRLLARGPRFRLEAEMVRDQALAFSGLLSRKVGGPSVFPAQPEGLWQAAFNGQRTWATSSGDDHYRRALYTFWRRTVPYPSMAAFDAPSREICAVRRIRTNTPLQAFVTLNDPVYVEAAQALARRIVAEGGTTADARARFALRLCLSRSPAEEQVGRLVALVEAERNHYRDHLDAAKALATDPLGPLPIGMDAADLAAWTTAANVLLNLDGVLTKG
ncbi:MAG: DUF1553 domain-containing protein [Isosphaeraceae bacterium]